MTTSEQFAIFHAPSGMYLAELENKKRLLFVDMIELAEHATKKRAEGLCRAIDEMAPGIGQGLLLIKVEI